MDTKFDFERMFYWFVLILISSCTWIGIYIVFKKIAAFILG